MSAAPRRALVLEADDAVVSPEFLEADDRTRPYGLSVCELARLDRLVETAPWSPEDAIADVLAEFGDAERRVAAISHLRDPATRRWPRGRA